MNDEDLKIVIDAYISCAFWTELPDDCIDGLDRDDIDPDSLKEMIHDVETFVQSANEKGLIDEWLDAEMKLEDLGEDFWLTRNGHDTGFWDNDVGEVGQRLTELAKEYKYANLYEGNDGKFYHFAG